MKNKIYLLLLVAIFFSSLVLAGQQTLGTFKQNENVNLIQTCGTCLSLNISSITYPDSTIEIINSPMNKNGITFNYTFKNTSKIGQYIVSGLNENSTSFVYNFFITPDGNNTTIQNSLVQMFLLIFFFAIGGLFFILSKNYNLENLNNSLVRRYFNKNYTKLVLGSIFYNILKNGFIIYYLIGFFIISIATNLSNTYGLLSLVSMLKVILTIYSIGIILVGIIFLGYVQEWFADLLKKVGENNWGINK